MIDLVYVVEDDPIAVILVRKRMELHPAFGQSKIFSNGQEVVDQLLSHNDPNTKLPDLILLDLNMPIMDGWQFLEWQTQTPIIDKIPTFILTSSIHPQDMSRAKLFPMVKGFISKPLTQEAMDEIATKLISR
jgi:CheY-like chemotaxis protein